MALDYKKLSDDRRTLLNEIRLLIKKECPSYFQKCGNPSIIELLTAIFEQTKAVEKGRDAFRDELIRLGYDHAQLVALTEGK